MRGEPRWVKDPVKPRTYTLRPVHIVDGDRHRCAKCGFAIISPDPLSGGKTWELRAVKNGATFAESGFVSLADAKACGEKAISE